MPGRIEDSTIIDYRTSDDHTLYMFHRPLFKRGPTGLQPKLEEIQKKLRKRDTDPSSIHVEWVNYDEIERQQGKDVARQRFVEDFLWILREVGGPYGWDKRKEFIPEIGPDGQARYPEIEKLYNSRKLNNKAGVPNDIRMANCYYRHPDGDLEKIGSACVGRVQERLSQYFNTEAGANYVRTQNAQNKSIEVLKIGMKHKDPRDNKQKRFTGQGFGQLFLTRILMDLAEDDYQHVFLDTRDTNPESTRTFYLDKMGFSIIQYFKQKSDIDTRFRRDAPSFYTARGLLNYFQGWISSEFNKHKRKVRDFLNDEPVRMSRMPSASARHPALIETTGDLVASSDAGGDFNEGAKGGKHDMLDLSRPHVADDEAWLQAQQDAAAEAAAHYER